MLAEDDAEEPNREPRNGIDGIDLTKAARVKGASALCGRGLVALVNV